MNSKMSSSSIFLPSDGTETSLQLFTCMTEMSYPFFLHFSGVYNTPGPLSSHHSCKAHLSTVQCLPSGFLQDGQPGCQEALCPVCQGGGQQHCQLGQNYQGRVSPLISTNGWLHPLISKWQYRFGFSADSLLCCWEFWTPVYCQKYFPSNISLWSVELLTLG